MAVARVVAKMVTAGIVAAKAPPCSPLRQPTYLCALCAPKPIPDPVRAQAPEEPQAERQDAGF
jgi:hypothetical protein